MQTDFSKATLADVPTLVAVIRALRELTEKSGTITNKTQALILRTVPPVVLMAIAGELAKPTGLAAVLSGEKVAVDAGGVTPCNSTTSKLKTA